MAGNEGLEALPGSAAAQETEALRPDGARSAGKFTRGPWWSECGEHGTRHDIRSAVAKYPLAVCHSYWTGEPGLPDAATRAANAHLIAAAPAMYEALQKASAAFRTGQPQIVGDDTVYPLDGGLVGNALNAIRAALAQAEAA